MQYDFVSHLKTFSLISSSCQDFIRQRSVTRSYKSKVMLLQEGDVCQKIFFIHEGVLQGYKYYQEKEVATWFGIENQLATAFYSFVSGEPSYEGIQTLASTTVSWLLKRDWDELYERFPEGDKLGRKLTEYYYTWLERRSMSMQYHTPTERYHYLLETEPQLFQKVPLTYIASYLGLARETLSRLRNTRQ